MQISDRIAVMISYLFHPLLMPVIGVFIIFNSGSYMSFIPAEYKKYSYLIVFATTFLLPVCIIPVFFLWKLIRNIELSSGRERFIPLFIITIFFYVAYYLISNVALKTILSGFLFSTFLAIFFTLAISVFWKISAHMTGIGGITGLIIALSVNYKLDLMFFLIVTLFVSGLIAYARLKLKEHNSLQIYSGFALGLATVLLTLLIYLK